MVLKSVRKPWNTMYKVENTTFKPLVGIIIAFGWQKLKGMICVANKKCLWQWCMNIHRFCIFYYCSGFYRYIFMVFDFWSSFFVKWTSLICFKLNCSYCSWVPCFILGSYDKSIYWVFRKSNIEIWEASRRRALAWGKDNWVGSWSWVFKFGTWHYWAWCL